MRVALSATQRRGQALAQRPRRDVDKGKPRRRVAFEIRIDPPQVQEIVAVDEAHGGPCRIEKRCGVPFRQHESIVLRMTRIRGSNRISAKKSAAIRSAADAHVEGCPLSAAVVERIESMRSWVAML